jgi:GxxExxY protein
MAEPTPEHERVAKVIVDAAYTVHRSLGPGLLESVYEDCLSAELGFRRVPFQRQVAVPVMYRGIQIGSAFRIDLLVDGLVIVELKATEQMLPIHTSQLLTYLRLANFHLGLLINFNVPLIKAGIRRLVLSN